MEEALQIGGSRNWEDGRSTGKVFSVFGAAQTAQNVGRFWCRHPARLLWASGGHPRGQSRLIWVRQGRSPGAGRGTADLRAALAMGKLIMSEYLGAYAAVAAALVRARCMAESQESQESTEMDMVPGPEALPVSVDRKSVVTNWLAGIAGAFCMGLELTMLPDAGSRGRFCADMSVGAVSAGPEAEEAGRASAGSTSMLNPKKGFRARTGS
eukprot:scaffold4572_cov130-Isochrysis_galbana.AAC.2